MDCHSGCFKAIHREAPKQEPEPLSYLAEKNHVNYDIPLEVWIKPKDQSDASIVAKTNFKHLYWMGTQQLAHHTINGCSMRPGDIFATGTLSGPEPESLGCLLELTWNGQKEIPVGFFFLTVQRRGKTLPHLIHCIGEQLQNCISAITLLSGGS